MSQRVTATLAHNIAVAVARKKFGEVERALEAEQVAIGDEIAKRYVGKYMPLIAQLPTDVIRWASDIRTHFDGPEGHHTTTVMWPTSQSVPFMSDYYRSLYAHPDLMGRARTYVDRGREVALQSQRTREEIENFVLQFKTTKKLLEAWPEVVEYMPALAQPQAEGKALAIRVEHIRAILAA